MATTCEVGCDAVDIINDPGAAPYGNFINYYTFNPPENRLSLMPESLLQDLGCSGGTTLLLDVGCNSGVSGSMWAETYIFYLNYVFLKTHFT